MRGPVCSGLVSCKVSKGPSAAQLFWGVDCDTPLAAKLKSATNSVGSSWTSLTSSWNKQDNTIQQKRITIHITHNTYMKAIHLNAIHYRSSKTLHQCSSQSWSSSTPALHVLGVSLLQHTWFKWSGHHQASTEAWSFESGMLEQGNTLNMQGRGSLKTRVGKHCSRVSFQWIKHYKVSSWVSFQWIKHYKVPLSVP